MAPTSCVPLGAVMTAHFLRKRGRDTGRWGRVRRSLYLVRGAGRHVNIHIHTLVHTHTHTHTHAHTHTQILVCATQYVVVAVRETFHLRVRTYCILGS